MAYLNDLYTTDGETYDVIQISPTASMDDPSLVVVYEYSDIYPGSNDRNSNLAFDAIAQEFWANPALGETVTVSIAPRSFDNEDHGYTVILDRAIVARYVRCHGPQASIHGKEMCIHDMKIAGQDLYLGL